MFKGALVVVAATLGAAAHAADIGGWMERKRVDEMKQRDDCVEIIGLGAKAVGQRDAPARTPEQTASAADLYYASGLCYLYSEKVARDEVAAGAWLERAAGLGHPMAKRTLIALREPASAAAHPSGQHCHDLGSGRRLCHGGGSVPPSVDKP